MTTNIIELQKIAENVKPATVKGMFLDPEASSLTWADWSGDLQDLYLLLDCTLVDCDVFEVGEDRKTGEKAYVSVYFDDEYHLADRRVKYATKFPDGRMYYGKCLVVGLPDKDGNETSIPTDLAAAIAAHMRVVKAELIG